MWTRHLARRDDKKWSKVATESYPRTGKRSVGQLVARWVDDIREIARGNWLVRARDLVDWHRRSEANTNQWVDKSWWWWWWNFKYLIIVTKAMLEVWDTLILDPGLRLNTWIYFLITQMKLCKTKCERNMSIQLVLTVIQLTLYLVSKTWAITVVREYFQAVEDWIIEILSKQLWICRG